jgi:hypothetical protein
MTLESLGIEIVDSGGTPSPYRYYARATSCDRRLNGRPAPTKAQAKTNLIEDAIAAASYEPTIVRLRTGGRVEVRQQCVGMYWAHHYDPEGNPMGSAGGDEESALRRAAFFAIRDGFAGVEYRSGGKYRFERILREYEAEIAARDERMRKSGDALETVR